MKVLLIQPPSIDPLLDQVFLFEPLALEYVGAGLLHGAQGFVGGLCAGDDLRQIRCVVGVIQMGVGVEEDGHGILNHEIHE